MSESATDKNMPDQCPQCGAALPAGALEGLCPACLLKQGAETGPPPLPVPFQPPSLEEVARWFPQLEILAFIGKGGMGAVYQARQPALDRLVALKILPPQAAGGPGFAERFNREARALARLNHPNIVAVHEFGQAGGSPFFLMEYVDGLTLRQLEHAGRLSPAEALRIVPQICEALQYAHDEGIVHRDIKPENILIDKKGRVKIADFGIAKIIIGAGRADLPVSPEIGAAPQHGPTGAIGTPHYMAPEQLEQPQTVDHRADIFSLGVVFYEMLTGQLPLGKFAPPSRKVQMDARLDEVVLRALEREPELRYQRAAEVKTEIDTITSTPPGASPSGEHTRPRVFQPAPPPAGSPQSRGHFLPWLPLVFFSMGMLVGLVGMAIKADDGATWAFVVFFLALAVIIGLRVWPATAKLVVVVAMLGLLVHGEVVESQVATENARIKENPAGHNSILEVNYRGLWVEGLVMLIALGEITSGVLGWLAKARAERPRPQPASTTPPASPSGEHTRPRVFQPAPPPAGSFHSPGQKGLSFARAAGLVLCFALVASGIAAAFNALVLAHPGIYGASHWVSYWSGASVYIQSEKLFQNPGAEENLRYMTQQSALINSDAFLQQVAKKLELEKTWGVGMKEVLARLRKELVAGTNGRFPSMNIAVRDKSREDANNIAQTIAETYAQWPGEYPKSIVQYAIPVSASIDLNLSKNMEAGAVLGLLLGLVVALALSRKAWLVQALARKNIPHADNAPRASSPSPPQTCGGEGRGEEASTRSTGGTPPPPAPAAPFANQRVFAWLALGFFVVGLLAFPALMAIHTDQDVVAAFGAAALILALTFGVMSWRERLGKVSVIAVVSTVVGVSALLNIQARHMEKVRLNREEQFRENQIIRQNEMMDEFTHDREIDKSKSRPVLPPPANQPPSTNSIR